MCSNKTLYTRVRLVSNIVDWTFKHVYRPGMIVTVRLSLCHHQPIKCALVLNPKWYLNAIEQFSNLVTAIMSLCFNQNQHLPAFPRHFSYIKLILRSLYIYTSNVWPLYFWKSSIFIIKVYIKIYWVKYLYN